MSRADPKLVAKLKKYSKDQIIEALANQFNADYYIHGLLNHLEDKESDRLLKEHREAIDAEAKARKAFSEFIKEGPQSTATANHSKSAHYRPPNMREGPRSKRQ